MKLSVWIKEKGGNTMAARFLGVERNCAYAWVEGISLPRAHVMKLIVQKSKGKVTYKEMVDEYLEKKSKPRKISKLTKRRIIAKLDKKKKYNLGF